MTSWVLPEGPDPIGSGAGMASWTLAQGNDAAQPSPGPGPWDSGFQERLLIVCRVPFEHKSLWRTVHNEARRALRVGSITHSTDGTASLIQKWNP